jgi:precorrin-3B synthase
MNTPLRRGACPALSAPMPTGDGLIARLTLTEAISPAVLAGLAEASLAHGNGLMEITQRGNLQFRGLTAESAILLADAVNGLGIEVPTGLTVDVGPLAGIDPDELADPRLIAEAIRKGAASLADRLGPKVSVVVDGRGKIVLDAVQADIRLEAVHEKVWRLSVGGKALGFVAEPAKAALDMLSLIAERGRQARGRDLEARALADQLASLLVDGKGEVPAPTAGSAIGVHDLGKAGIALGLGVAFGQVPATALLQLAELATGAIRFAPGRCLLVLVLTEREARVIVAEAEKLGRFPALPLSGEEWKGRREHLRTPSPRLRGEGKGEGLGDGRRGRRKRGIEAQRPSPSPSPYLSPQAGRGVADVVPHPAGELSQARQDIPGLVTRPDDPRLFVVACAGSEGCASGHIPARAIAAELAGRAEALLDGSLTVHVSGCAKGCAHPAAAALTFVGDAEGAGLVVHGTASSRPAKHLAATEILAEAERLSKLVRKNRNVGETAAACLSRPKPGEQSERAA